MATRASERTAVERFWLARWHLIRAVEEQKPLRDLQRLEVKAIQLYEMLSAEDQRIHRQPPRLYSSHAK